MTQPKVGSLNCPSPQVRDGGKSSPRFIKVVRKKSGSFTSKDEKKGKITIRQPANKYTYMNKDAPRVSSLTNETIQELDRVLAFKNTQKESEENFSNTSPDPLVELKEKLIKEEAQLKEAEKEFASCDEPTKKGELKSKIEELKQLVAVLKQNLSLCSDCMISSGYVRCRKSQEEEFIRRWCTIDSIQLHFYQKESVCFIYFYMSLY